MPAKPKAGATERLLAKAGCIGVLGIIGIVPAAVGLHAIAGAQPARPVRHDGIISDYVGSRYPFPSAELVISGQARATSSYEIWDGDFASLPDIGAKRYSEISVLVDDGTNTVLAITLDGATYQSRYSIHPRLKYWDTVATGLAITSVSLAVGLWGWRSWRRSSRAWRPATFVVDGPSDIPTRWAITSDRQAGDAEWGLAPFWLIVWVASYVITWIASFLVAGWTSLRIYFASVEWWALILVLFGVWLIAKPDSWLLKFSSALPKRLQRFRRLATASAAIVVGFIAPVALAVAVDAVVRRVILQFLV